jgi:hypothetical protein
MLKGASVLIVHDAFEEGWLSDVDALLEEDRMEYRGE